MKIAHQDWDIDKDYLVIKLNEPYWSGYKQFGWEDRVEGYGVSLEGIIKAHELKKKIKIVVKKYGTYEISPKKAWDTSQNFRYKTRNGTWLLVLPRTVLEKYR